MADKRLSKNLVAVLEDSQNQICISSVSLHEYAIKNDVSSMPISLSQLERNWAKLSLEILGFNIKDALVYQTVKLTTKDPFDRAIVAQALANKITLITNDQAIINQKVPNLKIIS